VVPIDIFILWRGCRHCVVQVFDRGLRLLDGAIQMQELLIERPEAETNGSVPSTGNLVVGAAIADPFVVLKMADGALQLVVGGIFSSIMFSLCGCSVETGCTLL